MSFNVLHAYIIEHFDSHKCSVYEYQTDFKELKIDSKTDICAHHYIFHMPFIQNSIEELKLYLEKPSKKIYTYIKKHSFIFKSKLIKPPMV